ncbi:winged helix-turn-helix domain-containing protein [Gudongella sp. SC589]|uniref:winged helix-turn-helix domain-containing protein n=1 Tax=Gudongella sp. SC589 TaxID=3385990 RepID=UPI0039048794
MSLIYCVEDDESIRELILYALKNAGFEAQGFESGKELDFSTIPDILLLDIMLPGDDGYEILSKVRKNPRTSDMPVIMLTSKTSEFDKVRALDMGADDYMDKPFGVMELISRIRAVLRRSGQRKPLDQICLHGICLDSKKHRVMVDDKEIILTPKEFDLLQYLMENQGIVLSRDKIMNQVWGFDFEGETRTVDVHIRTLRMKLGDNGESVQTVRGIGYRFGGDF